MTPAPATKAYNHVGETRGIQDHDHDLVHYLSSRLDTLWRCDQCIANAETDPELQDFWRDIKRQETANVHRVRELIKKHVQRDCF